MKISSLWNASILLILGGSTDRAFSFTTGRNILSSAAVSLDNSRQHSHLHHPHEDKEKNKAMEWTKMLKSALLSAAFVVGTGFSPPATNDAFISLVPPAHAAESKVVGALKGSGLVFKDTLQIERFEDPKVQGVVLYISNFDRPITEKLSGGNFFNDPSYASVACARTGAPVSIADNIGKGPQGEEVFEESRSLLFKTLRVQRVYDEEKKTVVYVSYNTRLDKNDDSNKSRFKSSLCAINLE
jgi:catabolite regulation protein CreA